MLEPFEIKAGLQKINVNVSDVELDRFLRFLEKDINGKMSYMEFIEEMNIKGDKNFNPFQSVVKRLLFFIK